MAVSPSSQCYQAVRCRLRPHYDSIWVPDSLLVSAFDRFAATFRTGARCGSSVPGPMEHRKRLAKRHMGELLFGQSHSPAPIWELANLVDLTQWHWKPPTPADRRRRQDTNNTETRTLSDALLSPFRSFFPPHTDTTDDLRNRGETLLPQDVILSGVAEGAAEPLTSGPWNIESTPLDVIHSAWESFSGDIANDTPISPLFSGFCNGWRQALADGLFQAEAIAHVLTGINDGLSVLSGQVGDSRIIDHKILLMESTIEGLSQGRSDQAASFDHVAWNSILHVVSTFQRNTIRIFTKAISRIPEQSLKEVSSGIMKNLDTFFDSLGQVVGRPTVSRQAAKMAVPLKSLGRLELRFILDDVTQKVLQYADVDGVNYRWVRLGWLLLLARMPGVDEEYLARVCKALDAGMVSVPLWDTEVCHLFLAWTNSQAPLEQFARLSGSLLHWRARCYRSLSIRLWQTRQYYRVRHLVKLLQALGRETGIASVSNFRRPGPCVLSNIAIKMRRPQAAVDILCLYEQSRRSSVPFWGSTICFKALKILIWVPNFDYYELWRVLRIYSSKQIKTRRLQGQPRRLNQEEIKKVAAVGAVMGLSPYLSNQQSFSLMTICYLNLRRRNAKLPRPALQALIRNVTRSLADGQPGNTSRLRYALHIIQEHLGRKHAIQIGMEIDRWRKSNFGPK
ncbi:hypothetical protein EV127DRAFT_109891 [Xylaria flabelliformis]|nr:hypothetical protein EV127DRAFT_109891 [Xylaria flabelliformis]